MINRLADHDNDGWILRSGEEVHHAAPHSFWIPPREAREHLEPGDLAKLIFEIALKDDSESVEVERMWVVVCARTAIGYVGILDNDPTCIPLNPALQSGLPLAFAAEHVIDIETANDVSRHIAAAYQGGTNKETLGT